MSEGLSEDVLQQRWVESREEASEHEMVFRPSDYNFPPARGRSSFELKPDGTLVTGGSGPTDRRVECQGRWELRDDSTLAFYMGSESEPSRVLRIVHADKDQLRLAK